MPAHFRSLLLPSITAEEDIYTAIAVISQNDAVTERNLTHISSLTDPTDFSTLLWVLDLKHLRGSLISTLFSDFYGGKIQPFVDHVMQKLPCQICGEVQSAEKVLQMYDALRDGQDFFAPKFGASTSYAVKWQLDAYHRAVTPAFFRRAQPLRLLVEEPDSPGELGQVYLQADASGRLCAYVS